MAMQKFNPAETDDAYWSDSYRGHAIATLNHGKGWLVYLDHVLQHGKLFVTAEAAVRWLRQLIDTRMVSSEQRRGNAAALPQLSPWRRDRPARSGPRTARTR
jgi:hypothetical protein